MTTNSLRAPEESTKPSPSAARVSTSQAAVHAPESALVAPPDPSALAVHSGREAFIAIGDEGRPSGVPVKLTQPEPAAEHLSLRIACESFEEVQRTRISIGNRMGADTTDSDLFAGVLDHLERSEHELALFMRRTFRRDFPVLASWQKETLGVGEHLLARLIAHIGDPVITTRHAWEGEGSERELVVVESFARKVGQLWSYCGHGDPARRRRTGMSADDAAALGNPQAKMLTHLIAESIIKVRHAPLRGVYDEARVKYAERDGWSAGRQHNAALRLVGKTFLRELWLAAGGNQFHPLPGSNEAPQPAHRTNQEEKS